MVAVQTSERLRSKIISVSILYHAPIKYENTETPCTEPETGT